MYNLLTLIGVKKLLGVNEENHIEMETRYDSVTKRLMILSNIPDKGRISVNDNGSISLENESKFIWLKRSITGDDRARSIKAIKNIINKSEEFVMDLINNKYLIEGNKETEFDKMEYSRKLSELICIYKQLKLSKNGISKLRLTTYKEDIPICSDIQIIENKIESIVDFIKNKICELKEDSKIENELN